MDQVIIVCKGIIASAILLDLAVKMCSCLCQGWFVCGMRSQSHRMRGVCRRWLHFSSAVSTTRCSSLRYSVSSIPPAPFTHRRTRRLCRHAYSRILLSGQKLISDLFHTKRTSFKLFFFFACRLVYLLPNWLERGHEPFTECLRASTAKTRTHGFFVAMLERRPPQTDKENLVM